MLRPRRLMVKLATVKALIKKEKSKNRLENEMKVKEQRRDASNTSRWRQQS